MALPNTITNAHRTEVAQNFYSQLADHVADITRLTGPVITTDAPNHTEADLSGITAFSQYTSLTVSGEALTSDKNTVAVVPYAKVVELTWKDIRDVPGILGQTAAHLGRVAGWSMRDTLDTVLWALDATAHPSAGGTFSAGAQFADNFTTGAGDPVTQDNLLGASFSQSGLDSGLSTLRKYQNKDGVPVNAAMGEVVLYVQPDQETDAINTMKQMGYMFDGAGLVAGGFGERISDLVVAPKTYDANDWMLINRTIAPVKFWQREAPSVTINPVPNGAGVYLVGYGEWAVVLKPSEVGLVYSAVA